MQTQVTSSAAVPARASLALLERYRAVRACTMGLIAPLSPEDMMVQSCPEASPVKWHLAHTTWFFETFVLAEFLDDYRPFHPEFRWLFNSYYNSLGDMPEKKLRSSFSRPPLTEILAYRTHVDAALEPLLQHLPEIPADRAAVSRVALGLEHEQQHQELIATDIKHALFTNPLHPAFSEEAIRLNEGAIAPPLEWISYAGGLTEIGVTPSSSDEAACDYFCFDNETPRHTVYLHGFALATRAVTCSEYLAFIEDSGYTRPELWLSEGWTAVREQGWDAPLYWQRDTATRSGWRIFTMAGWQPLEVLSETPVCHISLFEADAFARWVGRTLPGARLPTEFEWEHAASSGRMLLRGAPRQPELLIVPQVREGESAVVATAANLLESGKLHPVAARGVGGLQQMMGDVWEWTSSGYTGYPGYRPLPGALGEYNGKFMSSQVILRGGSCVTPATHIRATYRNFFSPGTRWQFSGLRLARDL